MPEITATMVMQLRERTGSGVMLCKEALKATDGDFEAASFYILKKIGYHPVPMKEPGASEGVVAIAILDGQDAAIIELNCETDFIARTEDFKMLARELAELVARHKGQSIEAVMTQASLAEPDKTMQRRLENVTSRLSEKIVFKRFAFLSTDANGALAGYIHVPATWANDEIGVLVESEARSPEAAKSDEVQILGRELAKQIAITNPRFQSREEVPTHILDQVRENAATTARQEGAPEAAIEKIVAERVRKFYEEMVLMDQWWFDKPEKSVAQILQDSGVALRRFVRYRVRE